MSAGGLFVGSRGRLAVEALVITGSILLAFLLEAGWSASREQARLDAQLEAVRDELGLARAQFEREVQILDALRAAIVDLLRIIGPATALVEGEEIMRMMDLAFRNIPVEVPTAAVDALIASGELSEIDNAELRAELIQWPREVQFLRSQSAMLVDDRERIIRYAGGFVPMLGVTRNTGQMDAYPPSDFVVDAERFQRDLALESLYGNRGMLVEDLRMFLGNADARAAALIRAIDRYRGGSE